MNDENDPALRESQRLIEDAMADVALVTCPTCKGTGKIALEHPCLRCDGNGKFTVNMESGRRLLDG